MLPTLLGQPQQQKKHEYLYWELNGQQAIRMGKWKALRVKPDSRIELYDLDKNVGESHDLADEHPKLATKMDEMLRTVRTESDVFPLRKAKS
jgi:arylsulfatase A-like enzyme